MKSHLSVLLFFFLIADGLCFVSFHSRHAKKKALDAKQKPMSEAEANNIRSEMNNMRKRLAKLEEDKSKGGQGGKGSATSGPFEKRINDLTSKVDKLNSQLGNRSNRLEKDKSKGGQGGKGSATSDSLEKRINNLASKVDKLNSRMGQLQSLLDQQRKYQKLDFLISCAGLESFEYRDAMNNPLNSEDIVIEILKYSLLGSDYDIDKKCYQGDFVDMLHDQLETLLGEGNIHIEYKDDDEDHLTVRLDLK